MREEVPCEKIEKLFYLTSMRDIRTLIQLCRIRQVSRVFKMDDRKLSKGLT